MALVRTDYGLIYNTDGSLCATLLPEGGVAIEEKGRENLLATASAPAEEVVTVVPGDTYTLSVYGNDPSSSGTVAEVPDYYASFNNHANIVTKNGDIISPEAGGVYTLLPDGGVAVTEGTTNLCNPSFIYKNTWTTIGYGWNRRTIINCTAGDVFTISADIRNLSQGASQRWGQVAFHDSGGIELANYNAWDSGMSEQRLSFTTPAAPMGTVEARVYWVSTRDGVTYQGKNFQIEKKPYSTPFTEGTRPAGRLSYDIPQLKGARDFTLHFKFLPYMFKEANWQQYLFSTRTDNYLHYYASINNSGTQLAINTALEEDNTWVYARIDNPPININSWHRFVMTGRQEGDQATLSIYLDGVEVYTSTRVGTLRPFPGILALGTSHILSYAAFNGAFRELYICPYAVSAETVATWHNRGLSVGSATPEAPLTFIPSIETLKLVPTNLTKWQLEKGDKANPFVIGYAPPGRLQYQTNLSLLQSGTIAFTVWTPKTEWDQSHNALLDVGGILQLKLDADGIEGCPITVNQKYKCVVTWGNGANTKLYINGELWKTWDTLYSEAGDGIVRFGRWKDDLDSVNTLRFENVLIRPEVVTAETVATWHSLDAPFFDPREQIDAAARTIYAPGVIIDNTGAWGIANGIKQAGFGTDGKWVAGGGKVVSDAQGLRTYDKPYTDPTAVKQVEIGTDGALNFGGGAGRADSEGMILYDITDPDNPKPMIRFVGKTGSADFEGVVKAKTLVVPVGTNRWG